MKVLLLGGRNFLGRHIVDSLRKLNYDITLFNRGRTNPDLFNDLEVIIGDRQSDFHRLSNRSWNVVIDTSGYFPNDVGEMARQLCDQVDHYIFISSCSVYNHLAKNERLDESGPIVNLEVDIMDKSAETYGARKYLCEKAIAQYFHDRLTVIRPGLIVGPFDSTYRFPYWIDRISSGGTVLAPGDPLAPLQFIDARDLAEWITKLVAQKRFGVFNAVGPEEKNLTLGDFLAQCVDLLNSGAKLQWVSEEFLKEQGIECWSVLPLWLHKSQDAILRIDSTQARAAGLHYRSIETTILDTRNWLAGSPPPHLKKSTLSLQKEEEVLTAWNDLQKRLVKLNQETVAIVPYKNEWIIEFLKEKEFLSSILPTHIIRRIEHFGSTAVPGLSAKPIIDILVEVSSFAQTKKEVIPKLTEQGYEYYWRPTIGNEPPYYCWLIKRNSDGVRTHHIHMVEAGSVLWERLYFRDYLCEFPDETARYEALKKNLSKINTTDRTKYTVGKTEYVTAVTEKAKAYYQVNRNTSHET